MYRYFTGKERAGDLVLRRRPGAGTIQFDRGGQHVHGVQQRRSLTVVVHPASSFRSSKRARCFT